MKVLLLFVSYLALAAVEVASVPPARFHESKIYRLTIDNELHFNGLKELVNQVSSLVVMNELKGAGHTYDVLVAQEFLAEFQDILEHFEFEFECIIEDFQRVLDKEMVAPLSSNDAIPQMNWTSYQNLPVIYKWLDDLAVQNSHLIESYVIGYSYENRPIKAIRISSKPGNKAIFIESHIHAIEWISSAAASCFIEKLINSDDKELKSLLLNYDWIFVPVLNPDGLAYTHDVNRLWRKNRRPTGYRNASGICYGIDLNRNFGYKWGVNAYNYDVPCDHFYAGAESDSEPEVQALRSFLDYFPDDYICIYLAVHAFGNYILLPYGHTSTEFPPNYDTMMKIAGAYADAATVPYGTKFKYGASSVVNYPVSGSSKDYAYGVKNIPFTATIELRDNGTYAFFLPESQILEVCKEVTVGLKAMVNKAQEEGIFNKPLY